MRTNLNFSYYTVVGTVIDFMLSDSQQSRNCPHFTSEVEIET